MLSDELYKNSRGSSYFAQRGTAVSDKIQNRRSKLFSSYIKTSDTVLDFGCGNGGILASVECAAKIGIEINEASVLLAKARGISVYESLDEIKVDSIDIIISNHSLEHCSDPLSILLDFRRKLKVAGTLIVAVPAENPFKSRFRRWQHNHQNHLFSWTPLSLGNLITLTGFSLVSCTLTSPLGSGNRIELLPTTPLRNAAEKLRNFALQMGDIVAIAQNRP